MLKGVKNKTKLLYLLSDFNVQVLNLYDLKCPNLSALKNQFWNVKPCIFEHNSKKNCAYINANAFSNV